MTRREIRENVFKMLFRIEFFKDKEKTMADQVDSLQENMKEQLTLFEEDPFEEGIAEEKPEDLAYIRNKCCDIVNRIPELDAAIESASKDWTIDRMSKMDVTILRLAAYEIRFEEAIPCKVAINEAVELAKKYGTEDSYRFVNGILSKLVPQEEN